jgi:hypothetical protein
MDNTNNKNVFSLKLFWQTVIQLKVIGFISLAVVAFVSGFPIIIEGLNIKKIVNAANVAAESGTEVINIALYIIGVTDIITRSAADCCIGYNTDTCSLCVVIS